MRGKGGGEEEERENKLDWITMVWPPHSKLFSLRTPTFEHTSEKTKAPCLQFTGSGAVKRRAQLPRATVSGSRDEVRGQITAFANFPLCH